MVSVTPIVTTSQATTTATTGTATVQRYPSPVIGLMNNVNYSGQRVDSTIVLENFLPLQNGIRTRKGSALRVNTGGAAITSGFSYKSGSIVQNFAADSERVWRFDSTYALGASAVEVLSGTGGGEWRTAHFSTDGGDFLLMVNGTNTIRYRDASAFHTATLTGDIPIAPRHVWAYQNRVFFIDKFTMNAYYLGVNSIQGTCVKLPLSGVFSKGGSLLFGATVSNDTGEGMDDQCVFVTDQGEVAIYSGIDPSSATTWSLKGVYDIGKIACDTAIKNGGDLLFATVAGLIPLSAVIQHDRTTFEGAALSSHVREWADIIQGLSLNQYIQMARDSQFIYFATRTNLTEKVLIYNAKTGAWATIVGWDANTLAIFDDILHFGTDSGAVVKAHLGGTDSGAPYICRAITAYAEPVGAQQVKTAQNVRTIWRYVNDFTASVRIKVDYDQQFGAAPSAKAITATGSGLWGQFAWDAQLWATGENQQNLFTRDTWVSSGVTGRAFAVEIQIASSGIVPIDAELQSADITYTAGNAVTS